MTPGHSFLGAMLPADLERLIVSLGHRPFRARQLFEQLHRRCLLDLQEAAVLPAALRTELADAGFLACSLTLADRQESCDGTTKLALRTADGRIIETVLIPMENGTFTQCISSQVGCPLGCALCFTGALGFTRNLEAAEIVDQHRLAVGLRPELRVKNLVFMGMGEPLLNLDNVGRAVALLQEEGGWGYSRRRITLSTAGIIPGIEQLPEVARVQLAVSLNATTQEIRERLMPVARRYPLDELVATLRRYPLEARERLTLEYVLVGGVNDRPDHARQLVRLVSNLKCKINLIPFNPFPGCELVAPSEPSIKSFFAVLEAKNLTVTLRRSKGADILAACGQLAGKSASSQRAD